MSITTFNEVKNVANSQPSSPVSSAVWDVDRSGIRSTNLGTVRTLKSSNYFRKDSKFETPPPRNSTLSKIKSFERSSQVDPGMRSSHVATAKSDVLKQCVGGALFGMIVFLGIVISQPNAEETPSQLGYHQSTYSEPQQ